MPFETRGSDYHQIPQEEKEKSVYGDEESHDNSDILVPAQRHCWLIILGASWFIIGTLAFLNIYQWRRVRYDTHIKDDVYSPALPVVEYQQIVTSAGLVHDKTPYQGQPSEENNKLWKDLYNFGLTRISMEEASKLVNRTVPIPGEPGNYMVSLSVFHHLHCLNMIRQRIWLTQKEAAPEWGIMGIVHMDHCIDGLRQALMCSGDVTPRPFGWDPLGQNVVPVNRVAQTCRNFDAIRDWAIPRQVHDFDYKVHVDDPLGNVLIDESVRMAWPNGTGPRVP